ncbi:uncharacterized protein LOC123560467 [Mercenaria mercenaria]|uniref:uncharacterized protein LOC123560467 n=1 Tax=Mercenaria mercenaria TaxID=6596 RepID=UPI00234EFF2B|nr:uncharacterized protein LOC123560467 [Mercenaria mercenaria]
MSQYVWSNLLFIYFFVLALLTQECAIVNGIPLRQGEKNNHPNIHLQHEPTRPTLDGLPGMQATPSGFQPDDSVHKPQGEDHPDPRPMTWPPAPPPPDHLDL